MSTVKIFSSINNAEKAVMVFSNPSQRERLGFRMLPILYEGWFDVIASKEVMTIYIKQEVFEYILFGF